MQPMCLACGQRGATESDGLCAPCARGGSERSGLWAAGVRLDGRPAATPDEVCQVLAALGWPPCAFDLLDPAGGTWLLELPDLVERLLTSQGHVCQSAGSSRVEVDLP